MRCAHGIYSNNRTKNVNYLNDGVQAICSSKLNSRSVVESHPWSKGLTLDYFIFFQTHDASKLICDQSWIWTELKTQGKVGHTRYRPSE